MKKAKIIAIANQKGGVGKTTTVINLGYALGKLGKKILLIDTDSQANLTTGFGIKKENLDLTIFDVFANNTSIKDIIIKSISSNVDICPANMELATVDAIIIKKNLPNYLQEQLKTIYEDYDFIFIDCSPSLGIINKNVFSSSDSILIPVQSEFYALEGLTQLLSTISIIKRYNNPKLFIEGVLMTMFSKTMNMSYEIHNEIKLYFKKKVYNTIIYRNVKISESQSAGYSVIQWSSNSTGAKNYMCLAKEFLGKNK